MRDCYDVRVYLAPPEELRRRWKVQRDCSRRGYTTDEVLAELDRREPDSAEFIRPQERHADMVVSFRAGEAGNPHASRRRAALAGLSAPTGPLAARRRGRDHDRGGRVGAAREHLRCASTRAQAAEIDEAIWDKLHFATHLRSDRLGEFTIGNDLRRSESLALVQLLILYHLVTAKAGDALGGAGPA